MKIIIILSCVLIVRATPDHSLYANSSLCSHSTRGHLDYIYRLVLGERKHQGHQGHICVDIISMHDQEQNPSHTSPSLWVLSKLYISQSKFPTCCSIAICTNFYLWLVLLLLIRCQVRCTTLFPFPH
jgi:hypothetical protein